MGGLFPERARSAPRGGNCRRPCSGCGAPVWHHDRPVGAGLCPRPVGGRWRFCRGRPMCRPAGGSRAEACPGGHIGPPLRGAGSVLEPTEIGAEQGPCGAGRSPPPTGESEQGGLRRGEVTPPYGWLRRTAAIVLGSGAQRSVCASGREEMGGNPSFFRWTGVRAAVPRAWPPPTKFRAEIWGVGQVVVPYGKPDQPPKPAGTQRSVRASGREGWAGIDARTIPKGGTASAIAGAALSEAESAEREAGQIQSLPNDLRVQHGVQRLEVSAKPRPCSRRGCVN